MQAVSDTGLEPLVLRRLLDVVDSEGRPAVAANQEEEVMFRAGNPVVDRQGPHLRVVGDELSAAVAAGR
jgi:hypothetical protein